MGWEAELLTVVEKMPWRGTNYYEYHEYFVTEWGPHCEEGFMILRNAIKEHGEDRPFNAQLRNGRTAVWTYRYLDLGRWTYWTGKDWTKDNWLYDPSLSYGINRKINELEAG